MLKGTKHYVGTYLTKAEAKEAYINYCVENNLNHTLDLETEKELL